MKKEIDYLLDELIEQCQKKYLDSFEETGMVKILSTHKFTSKELKAFLKSKTLLHTCSDEDFTFQTYAKNAQNIGKGATLYNIMILNKFDFASVIEFKQLFKRAYFPYWGENGCLSIVDF